jgi:voltage-gated potassium channel
MGALGVVFLLVVLGQTVADDPAVLGPLSVLGWALWAAFVAEFVLRAVIARDQRRFWRRNWWQVVFLAVPFLRLVRALMVLRVARVGGILSAAVRGSRSAGRLLSGRVAWLTVVTAVVMLAASQLLFVLGAYDSYRVALHDAALSTITGERLTAEAEAARLLEVLLAAYSVGVFAVLAGSVGAYFLERRAAAEVAGEGEAS